MQALDHFLDKVRVQILKRGLDSEDAPSVVRLGSRSESDAIKLWVWGHGNRGIEVAMLAEFKLDELW